MKKTLMQGFFVIFCIVSVRSYSASDSRSLGLPRRPSLIERLTGKVPKDDGNKMAFATEEEGKKWLDGVAKKAEAIQEPPKRTQKLSKTFGAEPYRVHEDGYPDLFANNNECKVALQCIEKDEEQIVRCASIMFNIIHEAGKQHELIADEHSKELSKKSIRHAQKDFGVFLGAVLWAAFQDGNDDFMVKVVRVLTQDVKRPH